MAPDISGEDVDGRPFKLSDYRGKVVVLVFWGHWCGPCRSMYPGERALVEKFAGRPFALLGVNSDENRSQVKELMKKGDVTWRAWYDGQEGPIAKAWNVSGWPTVYVLDSKGVIRRQESGVSAALEATVEAMLKVTKE